MDSIGDNNSNIYSLSCIIVEKYIKQMNIINSNYTITL